MSNISKINYKGTTYDVFDATALHSGDAYTLPIAKHNVLGGVKPLYANTNAVTGVTADTGAKSVAVNALSTNSGRYYAVEVDKDGRLYVNVPWAPNADQTHSGTWDTTNGYKITLSGSNSAVTVPFFAVGTSGGLAKQPGAGDVGKFLRGDNTWATPADTTYSLSGGNASGDINYQIKLTTTGSSAQGDAGVATIPYFGAAVGGLLPAYTGGSSSDTFFSAAGWKTNPFNKYYIWFADVETNMGTTQSGTGHGNWDVTFPAANKNIGAGIELISVSGSSATPKVGDTVITKGGFIGHLTNVSSPATGYIATFVGRLSFMAYNDPTKYDASTQTLTLGSY